MRWALFSEIKSTSHEIYQDQSISHRYTNHVQFYVFISDEIDVVLQLQLYRWQHVFRIPWFLNKTLQCLSIRQLNSAKNQCNQSRANQFRYDMHRQSIFFFFLRYVWVIPSFMYRFKSDSLQLIKIQDIFIQSNEIPCLCTCLSVCL